MSATGPAQPLPGHSSPSEHSLDDGGREQGRLRSHEESSVVLPPPSGVDADLPR